MTHSHSIIARTAFVTALATLVAAVPVWAGSHTWRVNEIFSDPSGIIQFIELKECCGGQFETGVNGHFLTSNSRSYPIPGPALTPPTSLKTLLFATPACAARPGFPTPNYIFPAGSVPFFSINGDSLSYVPYDSMTFGAGVLPTDGIHSLNDSGGTNVVACNSPKNYAGQTGFLNLNCSLQGDVNNNGAVDGGDIAAFVRVALGTPDPGDSPACAEYCGGSLAANTTAFVADLLN